MRRALFIIKARLALVGVIIAATAVGGVTTAIVSAAIPDSGGTIHGCYKNSVGILNPKGSLRVVNTDSGESCTSQETPLDWSQQGSSAGSGVHYAVDPDEKSLSVAGSQAQNDLADLNGPTVTVNVPSTGGSLVNLYLSSDVKTPCDISSQIFVVDEANGQMLDQNLSTYSDPGNSDYVHTVNGGSQAGQWRGIEAAPGTHTYGLRYAVFPAGSDTSCSASFKNAKLWAEIKSPN